MTKIELFLALSSTLFFFGCATTTEAFGDKARYSPAFRGYVMAPDDGSHDPPADEPVVVLRDPLTGDKLVCAEQVRAVREIYEDLAAEQLHDDRVAIGVGVGVGLAIGPIAGLQWVGGGAIMVGLLAGDGLYDGFASDDAEELLEAGRALLERRRHAQAERHLTLALAKDPWVGIFEETYLLLGRAYLAQGKKDDARLALSLFVLRAAVRDVKAYEEAERLLEKLGVEPEECESRQPVALYW